MSVTAFSFVIGYFIRLWLGIEGVFEHHTGEIDLPKLESLLSRLADGSLKNQDVFDDMGHGALMYTDEIFEFGKDDFDVVVTGPRRSIFQPLHPSTFTLITPFPSGI